MNRLPLEAIAAAAAAFHGGWANARAAFEVRLARWPRHHGFFHLEGIDALLDALEAFHLPEDAAARLVAERILTPEARDSFGDLRLTLDVDAVRDGEIVFPGEPVVVVEGPFAQALLAASLAAKFLEEPTLAATRTARAVLAAGDAVVLAAPGQAKDPAAVTRAAYIGGAEGGLSFAAAEAHGVPWVALLSAGSMLGAPSGLQALVGWLAGNPEQIAFPLGAAGFPAVLQALVEAVRAKCEASWSPPAVLLALAPEDAPDLAVRIHQAFEAAELPAPRILVGPVADELEVRRLGLEGVGVSGFLFDPIGSRGELAAEALLFQPSLVAIEEAGRWAPRIEAGARIADASDPGRKVILRYFDEAGAPLCDVVHGTREKMQPAREVAFVDRESGLPVRLRAHRSQVLLGKVLRAGKRIHPREPIAFVRARATASRNALHEGQRRLVAPAPYPVGLTDALVAEKNELLADLLDARSEK